MDREGKKLLEAGKMHAYRDMEHELLMDIRMANSKTATTLSNRNSSIW